MRYANNNMTSHTKKTLSTLPVRIINIVYLTESRYIDQIQHKTIISNSSTITYVSTFTSGFQVQKYVRKTKRYDAITS